MLATVRALWREHKQAHALPAPLPGLSSENHYSTICLSWPWHIYTSHLWHLNGKQMQTACKEKSDPPLQANGSKVWTLPLRGLTLPTLISNHEMKIPYKACNHGLIIKTGKWECLESLCREFNSVVLHGGQGQNFGGFPRKVPEVRISSISLLLMFGFVHPLLSNHIITL